MLLLKLKTLTSGTTCYASALIGQLRAEQNMTRLAQYTTNLLANLEKETEQPNDFIQNGPISVADNKERMLELFRGASMVKVFGLAPGFRKIRWNYTISVFWQMNRLLSRKVQNGKCDRHKMRSFRRNRECS